MKNFSFITLKVVSRVALFFKNAKRASSFISRQVRIYVTYRNTGDRKFGSSEKKTERVDLEMHAPFVLTIPLAFKNLTKALVFFLFCVYCLNM